MSLLILQVFQQYAGILQQKYPDISVSGDNFPPGGYRWVDENYKYTSTVDLKICRPNICVPCSDCKPLKL